MLTPEIIEFVESSLLIFLLSIPRMAVVFLFLPFLGRSVLGGTMLRNGVTASLALFLFPVVLDSFPVHEPLSFISIVVLLLKESMIGVLMGFCVAVLFWAIEAAGFFIDNQRGSTMASSMNPLSGEQTSILGILLSQAMTTVFFTSGLFMLFLYGLYESYHVWPLFSYYPTLNPYFVSFFLGQMDLLMYLTVVLASPVIIAMFFTEFGLAMVGRFAPQMDVFFLAMPIKSAVAMSVLIIYVAVFITYFRDEFYLMDGFFKAIAQII